MRVEVGAAGLPAVSFSGIMGRDAGLVRLPPAHGTVLTWVERTNIRIIALCIISV